jgi:hypothetical protein
VNARVAVIFVVLLAVIGGGALFYYHQERTRRPANVGTLGQTLLKGLQAADIASIRIVEPKSTLTLQRREAGWVLAERDGFAADLGKVRAFVVQALSLKVGQSEPIGEQDRARMNLDQSGTQIEFNGADGQGLARLIVGKKYFRREVDNPEKAPGDGRFVMLPDDPKTVYTVSDPLRQASARSADWIERGAFKLEKVKSLEVRYPDGSSWRIERSADNAEWKLAGARPGEKLDIGRANSASYSLSLLELADVAPKEAGDTGLDSPTLINAVTLDGVGHSIKVGRLEGENYYVSFPPAQFIVLVAKSKLDDTLQKRAQLLEKKQDTKK